MKTIPFPKLELNEFKRWTSVFCLASGDLSDVATATIMRLFGAGKTVLLPIPIGGTILDEADWQTIKVSDTLSNDYLEALAGSNIAVACGRQSFNLCAFQFADSQALDGFLAENPELASTVITRNPYGLFLWVCFVGSCPPTVDLVVYKILADQSCVTVFDRLDKSGRYLVRPGQIVIADFTRLRLTSPNAIALRFLQHTKAYGHHLTNRRKLNTAFWAACYAGESHIKYDPHRKLFHRVREGRRDVMHEDLLKKEVFLLVDIFERIFPKSRVKSEIRSRDLDEIVKLLKTHAAHVEAGEENVFDTFLRERVEHKQGVDTTTQELHAAYLAFCSATGLMAMPERVFFHELAPAMRELFGVARANDLMRDGTCRRGFRHIAVKEVSICSLDGKGPDGPDASDATFQKRAA